MRNHVLEKVVVAGMGLVSPLGNNVSSAWERIKKGESGISRLTRFDPSDFNAPEDFPRIAGEVKNFNLKDWGVDEKAIRRMDPFTQYLVAASIEAYKDSGIEHIKNPYRIGIITGSGFGGASVWEEQHWIMKEKGSGKVSPFFVPMVSSNMASSQVSILLGLKGISMNINSACASSGHAIAMAYYMIRTGVADVMITGGTEACIAPLALSGFNNMRAVSRRNNEPQKASRPFDRDRDGFVMSEGAGVLVLESGSHARKRRARIYARLAGVGMTSDACHITNPSIEGPKEAMRIALKEAEVCPEFICHINSHGTSTIVGDINETKAIKQLFGAHAKEIYISSTKSMTGHMLGAAGGAEAIFSILAINEGVAPPTINLENPDPECDLDYVPNQAREANIVAAVSNSFGFGGTNASLVFIGM